MEFLHEINKRLKKTPSKKELIKKYNQNWVSDNSDSRAVNNINSNYVNIENKQDLNHQDNRDN